MLRNEDGTFRRSLIYGVGIDDVDGTKEYFEGGVRKTLKSFQDWKNMLRRCYSKGGEYVGVTTVCDEWKVYSNFKDWFDVNYRNNCWLDKDLSGGKRYSPDNCIYISKELNKFLIGVNDKCGVWYDDSRDKFQSYTRAFGGKRINIGRFDSEQEALVAAKLRKVEELKRVCLIYKDDQILVSKIEGLIDRIYETFIYKEKEVA